MRQRVTLRAKNIDNVVFSRQSRDVYTVEGDFDFEVEDLDSYVNVVMTDGTSYEWTYRDPSESLVVGDLVEVPFGYDNRPRIAKVASLGKGYDGPYPIKDVSAVLEREAI